MKYASVVSQCGTSHPEWLKALSFYKDDLQTIKKRLEEIVSKNTSDEAREGVEHFQNQCIVQENNIDELSHKIQQHNKQVAEDAQAHAGKINEILQADHQRLQNEVVQVEKIINDLRHEFNEFATKWM